MGAAAEGRGVVGTSVDSNPNEASGEGSRVFMIGDDVLIGEVVGRATRPVTM